MTPRIDYTDTGVAQYIQRQKILSVVQIGQVNDRPSVTTICTEPYTAGVTSRRQFRTATEAAAYAESLIGTGVAHADELAPMMFMSGAAADLAILQKAASQARKLRLSRKGAAVEVGRVDA